MFTFFKAAGLAGYSRKRVDQTAELWSPNLRLTIRLFFPHGNLLCPERRYQDNCEDAFLTRTDRAVGKFLLLRYTYLEPTIGCRENRVAHDFSERFADWGCED